MSESAAKHLMKLMYGARMAYPQILTTITRLACNITKWTKEDDRHADLAGHGTVTSKSTSGMLVMLQTTLGNKTALFPLSWSSHKQASTSSSTSEAETVAMSTCLRSIALPLQHFLFACLALGVDITMFQDNTAAQQVVVKGYSGKMRSLLRTQRISIGGVKSTDQLADIFTKPLARPEFIDMSLKIGVRKFDDVMKSHVTHALPSSSHDDGFGDIHVEHGGVDEHVDLVVPGHAYDGDHMRAVPECDMEVPLPEAGDLDDTQARKLRREAFTFEHSMAQRPKNPFCGVCIAGKAIASKALVRAVSLSDQLGVNN
eukprot:6491627-Amphidinium_carterae.3